VNIDHQVVQRRLRDVTGCNSLWVVPHPQRPGALVAHVGPSLKPLDLIEKAMKNLHRYEVPTHICHVDNIDAISSSKLCEIVPKPGDAATSIVASSSSNSSDANDPVVTQVQNIFMDLLDLDYIPQKSADFFQVGGSSMTASQLASKFRKTFGISCTGAEIFHHSTIQALAHLIHARQDPQEEEESSAGPSSINRSPHEATFPSKRLPPQNSFVAALIQLIPMFLLFPVWQISRYLLFFATLLQKSRWFPDLTDRDIVSFLLVYVVFHLLWITIAPLVFVAIKWVVIGRYKPGRYPIWGCYYLRWWFVDVCRKLFLRGIWGSNDTTLRWYYRMLGANIGENARISLDCDLAEYDLVSIGKNAAVDLCTLRGFGVDNGCMLLGQVKVGDNASAGTRSVVAPNTSVADGEHLGPGTSTYDETGLHPKHARVNRKILPDPSLASQLFLGLPLTFVAGTFGQIPPLMCTYGLLYFKSRENTENFFSNWNELMGK